jgi:hypothetical protein
MKSNIHELFELVFYNTKAVCKYNSEGCSSAATGAVSPVFAVTAPLRRQAPNIHKMKGNPSI